MHSVFDQFKDHSFVVSFDVGFNVGVKMSAGQFLVRIFDITHVNLQKEGNLWQPMGTKSVTLATLRTIG